LIIFKSNLVNLSIIFI